MIDIKLIRENKDIVKENIKKKFQDEKLPLVDEIYKLDEEFRNARLTGDKLRAEKNTLSKSIGVLMKDQKLEEVEKVKNNISEITKQLEDLGNKEVELETIIKEKMMVWLNLS